MTRKDEVERKERHSGDPKSSVRAPPKKAGGGGKYTMGKAGDEANAMNRLDYADPNYDPDEKRIDPDDGLAYTFDQLALYYKGKFKKAAIEEYWENECTPVKRKAKAKAKAASQGPTPAESVGIEKAASAKAKAKAAAKRLTPEDMDPNGPLAKELAAVIPYFPFKKLEKFYDVQGLLKHPKLFNALCALMAKRFRKLKVTKIVAFEARGFLFTPVAIKLGVPFIMLRKDGKMPNTISSAPYTKEYEGIDAVSMQKGAVVEGDKVVLIDDLLATGGTMLAGVELIKSVKAEVEEAAVLIELKGQNGRDKLTKAGVKSVFGFISEELLTLKAELPEDYVDDGKA